MRKRQKFVFTAVVLAFATLSLQSVRIEWRYGSIALVALLSWVMSVWSLKEGLSGVEWLTVTLPSVTFTASVGLFYILLPQEWWAKLLIMFLFGVGQYAQLLTANIFSVAAIRTIALLRAAHAIGFAMTLLTGFFLYDTILSFKMEFWWLGLFVGLVSFVLLLPSLWSVELELKLNRKVLDYSIVLAICVGILTVAISFWPLNIAVASLFLTTMLYIFLGISEHHFDKRLFKKTIYEYLTVGAVVLVTMLLTGGVGA